MLRSLQEAGYIALSKRVDGGVSRTEYQLTPAGRKAFERYLDHMETIIRTARRAP